MVCLLSRLRGISLWSPRGRCNTCPRCPLWVFNPFILWWTTSKTQQRPAVLWSVSSARVKELPQGQGKKPEHFGNPEFSLYLAESYSDSSPPFEAVTRNLLNRTERCPESAVYVFIIFVFLDGIQQRLFLLVRTPSKQRNVSVDYRLP